MHVQINAHRRAFRTPSSILLQRLVALEKQVAAAASSPAGERSRSARRPRTPLVLYQAPRRSEVGDADAQAAA